MAVVTSWTIESAQHASICGAMNHPLPERNIFNWPVFLALRSEVNTVFDSYARISPTGVFFETSTDVRTSVLCRHCEGPTSCLTGPSKCLIIKYFRMAVKVTVFCDVMLTG